MRRRVRRRVCPSLPPCFVPPCRGQAFLPRISNRPIGRLEIAVSPFAFIKTSNPNRDRMALDRRTVFLATNCSPLGTAFPNRKSQELEMGLNPVLSTKVHFLIASQTGVPSSARGGAAGDLLPVNGVRLLRVVPKRARMASLFSTSRSCSFSFSCDPFLRPREAPGRRLTKNWQRSLSLGRLDSQEPVSASAWR